MLFETKDQFEKKLKSLADKIDPTGEFAGLVIDYLFCVETPDYSRFLLFLKEKGERITHITSPVNPRYGNLTVDLVGGNARKYFFGLSRCKDECVSLSAEDLLYEVSHYLAIITTVLMAEEKKIVKDGLRERFMVINSLFYAENAVDSSVQFGYSATRLDVPYTSLYLLNEAKKLFKTIETISTHGVHIVHGDFKLDNVLVNKEGRLCLIDFGLSTIRVQFGDGVILDGKRKQKAIDLMFLDPLLFAITYSNETPVCNDTGKDYFDILHYYDSQEELVDDMYDIAYNFFYYYHLQKPFDLETHFCEYLKLKKS